MTVYTMRILSNESVLGVYALDVVLQGGKMELWTSHIPCDCDER